MQRTSQGTETYNTNTPMQDDDSFKHKQFILFYFLNLK